MNMSAMQCEAMRYALAAVKKLECNAARIKLLSGLELDSGDCRALLVACNRHAETCPSDVRELNEWFFARYDFDNKIKFDDMGRLEFCE